MALATGGGVAAYLIDCLPRRRVFLLLLLYYQCNIGYLGRNRFDDCTSLKRHNFSTNIVVYPSGRRSIYISTCRPKNRSPFGLHLDPTTSSYHGMCQFRRHVVEHLVHFAPHSGHLKSPRMYHVYNSKPFSGASKFNI